MAKDSVALIGLLLLHRGVHQNISTDARNVIAERQIRNKTPRRLVMSMKCVTNVEPWQRGMIWALMFPWCLCIHYFHPCPKCLLRGTGMIQLHHLSKLFEF